MIAIMQGERSHNCFGACLASLLHLPLSLVPDFGKLRTGARQTVALQEWLATNYHCSYVELSAAAAKKMGCPALGIGSIRYTKDWFHAVVARATRSGLVMVHDPDPRADGLQGGPLVSIGYVVPLNPEKICLCCVEQMPPSSAD